MSWDGEEEDLIKRKTLAWHVDVIMVNIQKKVLHIVCGLQIVAGVSTVAGALKRRYVPALYTGIKGYY